MSENKALVVDDSSTSRILLAKVLEKMSISCDQAVSGEDALDYLKSETPDFIFLDHLMPGMDGFQTLEKIKNDPSTRHIPVIMYTSQHAHKYYEEAHELGAAGVISKQIDRDKLYLLINSLCVENESPEIPTVYEEVHQNLQRNTSDSSSIRLLARIATLESAYEELHEENRQMKREIGSQSAELADIDNQAKKSALPQFLVILFLSATLFIASSTWLETRRMQAEQQESRERAIIVNELINEIIDVLEQNADK